MKAVGSETVRGCEKRIFYVKNTGSELFDEAYLVLKRRDGAHRPVDCRELEREAGRLLCGASSVKSASQTNNKRDRLRMFFAGAAVSAIVSALVVLAVCLAIGI